MKTLRKRKDYSMPASSPGDKHEQAIISRSNVASVGSAFKNIRGYRFFHYLKRKTELDVSSEDPSSGSYEFARYVEFYVNF